jgi:DNA-binding transcriptional LysR family regulator
LARHNSREVNVANLINFNQKQAAVALADTLNYGQAAQRLGITALELKSQIEAFEAKLCLRIFDSTSETLALTEDGHMLIEMIREALHHKRGMKTE